MDETIFSQKGLENLLNPSKKKQMNTADDVDPDPEQIFNSNQFSNYFQNWPKNNIFSSTTQDQPLKNSDLEQNSPVLPSSQIPSTEKVHDTQTNPESFPQVMEHLESLGRVPSQQVITFVIQMLNTLMGQSEFQDQLIQELLRRKDFCDKMRTILMKDSLNQSLKY